MRYLRNDVVDVMPAQDMTMLFADIVGFTGCAAAFGDDWLAVGSVGLPV